MSLSKSEKLALDDLIAKGDLVGAQNLLAGKTNTPTVEAPAAPEPPPPPPKRSPEQIVLALFQAFADALGNKASTQALIDELAAKVSPTQKE